MKKVLLSILLVLMASIVLTARYGDSALFPGHGDDAVDAYWVSNGYHSGLVLPRDKIAAVAGEAGLGGLGIIAARFGHYDWVEFGWGEERFYREVPTLGQLNWRLALSALFSPGNRSVLHVVGIGGSPREVFAAAEVIHLPLSREGMRRMLVRIDQSVSRNQDGLPRELGPGLYGPSLFYAAEGSFSLFNVCNHWTAELLDAAGVPIDYFLATVPFGLKLDLRLRSGLKPLPQQGQS